MRMHWFRYSAQLRRWTEQYNRVTEEMFRTIQAYKTEEVRWLERASERDREGNLGAGSHGRR